MAAWLHSVGDVLASAAEFPLLHAILLEAAGRPADAEKACRTLADNPSIPADIRARAMGRLTLLLLDRSDNEHALDLVEQAIIELGPHPDLLDARGLARITAGDLQLAMTDLDEAVLAPTPVRLLHHAHAKALAGRTSDARASLDRGVKDGLAAELLRPADRKRLEYLEERLGRQSPSADTDGEAGAGPSDVRRRPARPQATRNERASSLGLKGTQPMAAGESR